MDNTVILTENMSYEFKIQLLSQDDKNAETLLYKIAGENPQADSYFLQFSKYGLCGSKLYKLYYDCCKENMNDFYTILMAINIGILPLGEVQQNLSRECPSPFNIK